MGNMVEFRVVRVGVALLVAFIAVALVLRVGDDARSSLAARSDRSSQAGAATGIDPATGRPYTSEIAEGSYANAAVPMPLLPPAGLARSSIVPLPADAVPVRLTDWMAGDTYSIVVNVPMTEFVEGQYQNFLATGWAVMPTSREVVGGFAYMRIASGEAWADVSYKLQLSGGIPIEDLARASEGNDLPLNIVITVDQRPGLPPGPEAITDLAPLAPVGPTVGAS